MNKRMTAWIVGGLITVSAIGLVFDGKVSLAAEKTSPSPMMQGTQMQHMMNGMDPKAMAEMMKSPEMQKHCLEMMKNPEMQMHCLEMMKNPEMQQMMKQMIQQDKDFHKMMSDLVKSVDMDSKHTMPQQPIGASQNNVSAEGYGAHHG
ncbi:MAG: hypothetical protein N2491_07900 [Negativicutes bacterium]|nr:hypothetical protein [Negativicutes bacterium]